MSSSSWFAAFLRPAPTGLEHWLEAKAADGQILTEYNWLSPVRMRFTESAPAQIRYAIERRAMPAPMDYYRFREQQGWHHEGRAADFHLWSRPYAGDRPAGFIGEDLDHRASQLSVRLAVVAAVALVLAVTLGAVSGVAAYEAVSVDLWAPAVAAAVICVLSAAGAVALAVSGRRRTPDAAEADSSLAA